MVSPTLNQMAGTGWLAGGDQKHFVSRLEEVKTIPCLLGLEMFPSPASTRRQVIHRRECYDFFKY